MSSLSSHKTPAHRLHIEKAVDQLNKNVLACTDTGFSNETGKFNAANETHTDNVTHFINFISLSLFLSNGYYNEKIIFR